MVQPQPASDTDDDKPISALLTPRVDEEVNNRPHIAPHGNSSSPESPPESVDQRRVCPEEPGMGCRDASPSLVSLHVAKEINELKSELHCTRNDIEELRTDFRRLENSISTVIQEKLNILIEAIGEVKHQGDSVQNLITQGINRKNASESSTPRRPTGASPSSPVTPSGAACRRISPFYGTIIGNLVQISVDSNSDVFIDKDKYEQYFLGSSTATSFIRKLMPHFFSSDEMLRSNFDGGEVVTGAGKVLKLQLDRPKVRAILRQAELEFKGSTQTTEGYAKLRSAINDRCRSEGRRQ